MRAKKTLAAIIVVLLIITTPAFAANYTRAYLETVGEQGTSTGDGSMCSSKILDQML